MVFSAALDNGLRYASGVRTVHLVPFQEGFHGTDSGVLQRYNAGPNHGTVKGRLQSLTRK